MLLSLSLSLQDKKIDVTTHVKQTQEKIADIVKRNDLRSKDVEAKQRQEDFYSLQRMKQWYEDMLRISSQLADVAIHHISNEFMEVTVLKSHSLRFFYDSETLRVRHVEVRGLALRIASYRHSPPLLLIALLLWSAGLAAGCRRRRPGGDRAAGQRPPVLFVRVPGPDKPQSLTRSALPPSPAWQQ